MSTNIEGHKRLVRKTKEPCSFRISGNVATIAGTIDIAVGTRITVADLRGRTLAEGHLDKNRLYNWNFPGSGGGMYLVSIGNTGQKMVKVRLR